MHQFGQKCPLVNFLNVLKLVKSGLFIDSLKSEVYMYIADASQGFSVGSALLGGRGEILVNLLDY